MKNDFITVIMAGNNIENNHIFAASETDPDAAFPLFLNGHLI